MARITRRRFVQGSAAAGGALVGYQFLFGGSDVLVGAKQATSTAEGVAGAEDTIRTACWIGKQDCGIVARRVGGRAVSLQGDPLSPRNQGKLCPKGVGQITSLYDPARVMKPLVRTNAKGQPGKWRVVSWDEATKLVADKLTKAAAIDKKYAGLVIGRDKMKPLFSKAIPGAFGITNYGRFGQDCDAPMENSLEATWGADTVVTPDLRHCKYLVCYWGLTTSGGPGLCQITLPQEVRDARERGMKLIAISPYARPVAHFADEWLAVKPGTDMTFWLAVMNVLFAEGFIDQDFLKKFTNAAVLVRGDGTVAKAGETPLVWDTATGTAVPEGSSANPALFGRFDVDGQPAQPALQVLKDQVAKNTPEWAATVCDVPAEDIRKLAHDLGTNATIGATATIDGVQVPSRPVAYGGHGVNVKFWSGFQTHRAILLAFMMLGAIESAGSAHFWDKTPLVDPVEVGGEIVDNADKAPELPDLRESHWFPFESAGYLAFPEVLNDLKAYGLDDFKPEDMAVVVHFVNPLLSSRPQNKVVEAWKKIGFAAVLTPYMSATADYAADVVLPCGTLDKWEGPLGGKTLYQTADSVRVPIMEPWGESRSELEIWIDLAEGMGKLAPYLTAINKALKIALPTDTKPTYPQILEAWAQAKYKMSLPEFLKGVPPKDVPAKDLYLTAANPPFGGHRAQFYQEAFLLAGQKMKASGGPAAQYERWTPYPAWTPMPIDKSPPEYDLYLMDFKRIEFKQTRTTNLQMLRELAPDNPLVMSSKTAKQRGLKDGDLVEIVSHNPITGETNKTRTVLATTQGIRPDTVGITHHRDRLDMPSANELLFNGPGLWDIGSGWFSHVKVKVRKVSK